MRLEADVDCWATFRGSCGLAEVVLPGRGIVGRKLAINQRRYFRKWGVVMGNVSIKRNPGTERFDSLLRETAVEL